MTISDPVPTPTPTPPETHLVEAKADGNPIARAIVAAVVAGLITAITALNNGGGIESAEWVAIVISFLVTGGAVWAIPTMPAGIGAWGKAITAAVVTALGVLGTGLANDGVLSQTEILMTITALLSGLLVSQTPEITHRATATVVPAGPTGSTPLTGK